MMDDEEEIDNGLRRRDDRVRTRKMNTTTARWKTETENEK